MVQGVSSISSYARGDYGWEQASDKYDVSRWGTVPVGKRPKILNEAFAKDTLSLMYSAPHDTKLLKTAQSYLGNIVEVTPDEYENLSQRERLNTQAIVIGSHGTMDEAWCAHTVSFMCEQAGIDIGPHKKAVSEFIQWGQANKIYHPIKTNKIFFMTSKYERGQRESQISQQIKNMREGDLIIWKSDTVASTQQGTRYCNASHIGIFEKVNPDGTISVLEGNANETKTGRYEKYVVTNQAEGRNGNQRIGEQQEVNPRDGFIRKKYTPAQLAATGYSGYIDMQSRIK